MTPLQREILERLAGLKVGKYPFFPHDAEAVAAALAEIDRLTPQAIARGPCGMAHHAANCNCDGEGGDR
jgi:hypothetical protein